MITLFITVGIYTIECLGSSCYSIDRFSLTTALATGIAELIFEVPNVISIYRGRDRNE
jgi:hypothetical protein